MASVARHRKDIVRKLKERGDVLSLEAAAEIERLLRIWAGNNEIFKALFDDWQGHHAQ